MDICYFEKELHKNIFSTLQYLYREDFYIILCYYFMFPPIKVSPIEIRSDPSLKGDLAVEQKSCKLLILEKTCQSS